MSTAETIAKFRALHERPGLFVIPNPWDIGSARLLADAGFEALATTSAGFAWSRGKPDGRVTLEEMLDHCAEIVAATPLPVNADLENCYAHDPDGVAHAIRLAAAPDWLAPRSKTRAARTASRSTTSTMRWSACGQVSRPTGRNLYPC